MLLMDVPWTNRFPFLQSLASWPVIITTNIIMIISMRLPASPLAASLGFQPLFWLYSLLLAATPLCSVLLTQGVKVWLLRRGWI